GLGHRPQECDLPGIQVGWPVSHGSPVVYTRIIFTLELRQFVRHPVLGRSQISLHMARVSVCLPQPQVDLQLFVLANSEKLSQTSDQRADQSQSGGILEIYRIDQHQLIELLPLGIQLTSHLVCKERTVAPAPEHVWSCGYNGAQRP